MQDSLTQCDYFFSYRGNLITMVNSKLVITNEHLQWMFCIWNVIVYYSVFFNLMSIYNEHLQLKSKLYIII